MALARRRLALLCAASLALGGCWQTSYGIPAWQVATYTAQILPSMAWCAIAGCPAELPEGVTLSTFDETLLDATPVALDVDAYGRVYVAVGGRQRGGVEDNRFRAHWLEDDLASRSVEDRRAYIQKWVAAGKFEPDHFTRLADRVIRLEDADGDGVADTRHDLAEFRDTVDGLAAGVLVEGGDVFASVIPHVWRLRDADGDGAPESRDALASGFGVKTSLLGHDLHGLVRGPDGLLYFSIGDRGYSVRTADGRVLEPPLGPGRGAVFRMRSDGSDLEVFATGLRNPQELAFDDHGNLFTVDNTGDAGDLARVVYIVEGGDTGWAMPYQTLVGDYRLGPWMEERLWETAHPGRPAWVVPPVAYLATGPAGLVHYPGLGLPDAYRGRFFVCDYAYVTSRSQIWSFGLEPAGAGFAMTEAEVFVGAILPTDFAFGYDGRMYVSRFDQIAWEQSIAVLSHDAARDDPRIDEVVALVREGMRTLERDALATLLGHADRRVRQRAQFELARRGETATFAGIVRDARRPLLARMHAVWGIGQGGARAVAAAGWRDLAWLDGEDDALRAQVVRVVGDAGAAGLAPALLPLLEDASDRVRFFAAQSLGALGAREAVEPLIGLLRRNADRDAFLRHAAVYALQRIGVVDAVYAHADDPAAAVRLGVLLVLRATGDARIERYLDDPDPFLVAEAARAIYDVPIDAAMPSLAAAAARAHRLVDEPRQTSHAVQRRAIGAALRLRSERGATALAAFAADARNPMDMRILALDALASYPEPAARDLAMGFHRPLDARPPEIVHAALDRHGPALVAGDLGARALEVATAHDRVPLDDEALAARVADASLETPLRVASLTALARRADVSQSLLRDVIGSALDSDDWQLRAEARDRLVDRDPAAAVASATGLGDSAPLGERQRAFVTLSRIERPEADAALADALAALRSGRLEPGLQLEVIEAARRRGTPSLAAQLAAFEAELPEDPVARRALALEGGDARRGERVFQGAGDCQRCHVAGGHGGGVGPDLAGVSSRLDRASLLRAVIAPQADVTLGYGTVAITRTDGRVQSGTLVALHADAIELEIGAERVRVEADQIASRTEPVSAMPPMGRALSDRDLRDLVEYLATL